MEEGYVKGPYKIAGIDVHKAMLAVVVTDAAKVGEFRLSGASSTPGRAVAHRLCRITWKILHDGVVYEERGQRTNQRAARQRAFSPTL
jgi:hypothetical protein